MSDTASLLRAVFLIALAVSVAMQLWLARRQVRYVAAHRGEVLAHFEGESDRLLIMDICRGDGWEVLCPFLGVPTRDGLFPHENQRVAALARSVVVTRESTPVTLSELATVQELPALKSGDALNRHP